MFALYSSAFLTSSARSGCKASCLKRAGEERRSVRGWQNCDVPRYLGIYLDVRRLQGLQFLVSQM